MAKCSRQASTSSASKPRATSDAGPTPLAANTPTNGASLLTFGEASIPNWVNAISLFAKYNAHAFFFPCGELDDAYAKINHTVRAMVCPNNRHTPEMDAFLTEWLEKILETAYAEGLQILGFDDLPQ